MIHDKDNKYRLLESIPYYKDLSPSRERHLSAVPENAGAGWMAA
jgi:hypothetical protein